MKIRTYLVLMTSAVLIPIIFFSAVAISTLFDTQRDAVLQGARETLHSSVLRADAELSKAVMAVKVLAQSGNLASENWPAFYRQAVDADADSRMITVVIDQSGHQRMNTFVAYGAPLLQTVPATDIRTIFTPTTPQISNVALGRLSHRHVVSVYLPVTARSGARYVVAQVMFASHFQELLPPLRDRDSGVHSMFDRNGMLIASNAGSEGEPGTPAGLELRHAMTKEPEGMLRTTAEGQERYTLFARSALSGWTFTLNLPVSNVESVPRKAMGLMALELFCVVVFATVAAAFFARRLTRSIECAFDSATALRQGMLPALHNSGIREFEELQSAMHEAGLVLKKVEAERVDLLKREREARSSAENKNATKDQFLAMLGHELRNPLAPISSAAQLLAMGGVDEARIKRATSIIVRQVKHMTYLVDDLLDVSRVTRGLIKLDRDVLDVKQILTDALEQVRPSIAALHHHFTSTIPEENICVMGDHKRLVQIFTNLLGNAAKYTPEGGHIALTVQLQNADVVITVQDDGIGMTPELLERAFELFAQAERTSERSQGGLGLGLALVKSLVVAHGGKVSAHSDGLGKGSTFSVSLPRELNCDKPLQVDEMLTSATSKSLRILIVDDNRDAANMLGEVVKAIGHSPIVEYNPGKALKRAASELPDVCLLDIGLPQMDGYELARRLRVQNRTSKMVLIAVTGYGQQGDCKHALSSGFDYHFVKPVDTEALSALLGDIARHVANEEENAEQDVQT
ncbi:MAG TPA: ATP-binding protein [Oxalicibacterium sp.]|nr:ATP-binding protein [Oxalicibacterium sp.]